MMMEVKVRWEPLKREKWRRASLARGARVRRVWKLGREGMSGSGERSSAGGTSESASGRPLGKKAGAGMPNVSMVGAREANSERAW